jgi:hypothetical protein
MSIFLAETLRLLRERPKNITLALITEETGLPKPWLDSILYRENPDPSITRIELLYNYLKGEQFSFECRQYNTLNNEE